MHDDNDESNEVVSVEGKGVREIYDLTPLFFLFPCLYFFNSLTLFLILWVLRVSWCNIYYFSTYNSPYCTVLDDDNARNREIGAESRQG